MLKLFYAERRADYDEYSDLVLLAESIKEAKEIIQKQFSDIHSKKELKDFLENVHEIPFKKGILLMDFNAG